MKGAMVGQGSVFLSPMYPTEIELNSLDRNLKYRCSLEYAEAWERIDHNAQQSKKLCVVQRQSAISDYHNGTETLIKGSLHLVSGTLCLLGADHAD